MSIGAVIVLSGFIYASASAIAKDITNVGYNRAKRAAFLCLIVGVAVDWIGVLYKSV